MFSCKSFVAVAILLACGTIAVSARDCPKACTLEFNQVCATNGKEYRLFDNPCMMDAFNCEHEFLWTRTKSMAPCLADTSAVSADIDDCVRPCGVVDQALPICAFDGSSYRFFDNVCEMHNAECGTDKHYQEANLFMCVPHPAAHKTCETPCTFEYNPVCGFNGVQHKTFDNVCMMNNEHCRDHKVWKQTRMDECKPEAVPFVASVECEKPCTFEYSPVCGFNGLKHEVFSNTCDMENAHCKDGKKWVPTPFTECLEFASVEKTHNCDKPCNKMYKPVCGFDGKMHKIFSNQCIMEVESCKDGHNWQSVQMSTCMLRGSMAVESNNKNDCVKPCNRMYAPVCGTDGQTYKVFSNQCVMENEHCYDNHQWHETNFGLCENPIPLAAAPKTECVKPCNRMYAPVCGTDGQTYQVFPNQCVMENQHCYDNHQWSVASFAMCEEPKQVKKDCIKICPRIYAPVCGTDGQTYQVFDNQCLMEKEFECDGHHWHATNFGLCENPIPLAAAPKKNCQMMCPLIFAPVCASNGKTNRIFSNDCELSVFNCQNDEHFVATFMNECQPEIVPAMESDDVYACPDIYDPQCGFDGFKYEVFANQCEMDAFNRFHKSTSFAHTDLSFCKHLL